MLRLTGKSGIQKINCQLNRITYKVKYPFEYPVIHLFSLNRVLSTGVINFTGSFFSFPGNKSLYCPAELFESLH